MAGPVVNVIQYSPMGYAVEWSCLPASSEGQQAIAARHESGGRLPRVPTRIDTWNSLPAREYHEGAAGLFIRSAALRFARAIAAEFDAGLKAAKLKERTTVRVDVKTPFSYWGPGGGLP